jgi:hypothetical protein
LEYLKNVVGEKNAQLPQRTAEEWIINGAGLMRSTKVFIRDRYSVSV